MIVFHINHTRYAALLKDMAAAFKFSYSGEGVLFIPSPGSGTLKAFELESGLQVLLTDATFPTPFTIRRQKSDKRYFMLHFDDASITSTARFFVDEEMLRKSNVHHSTVRLTSNMYTNSEEIPSSVHIHSVKILLPGEWLEKNLGIGDDTLLLQQYLGLKTESFDLEKLDTEYKQLIRELWSGDQQSPFFHLFLRNRVMLLIERFFRRLCDKMGILRNQYRLTADVIVQLSRVEQILLNDFSIAPPAITTIAKMVSMSTTNLKKRFRQVYGDSMYSYYQNKRMLRATELIATGRFSIKEVAEAIGYNNINNFKQAFRKKFHEFPSEKV